MTVIEKRQNYKIGVSASSKEHNIEDEILYFEPRLFKVQNREIISPIGRVAWGQGATKENEIHNPVIVFVSGSSVTHHGYITPDDLGGWYDIVSSYSGEYHSLLGLPQSQTSVPFDFDVRISTRNRRDVEQFLSDNPKIIEFILSAKPALVKHFGYPLEVILEVILDPADDEHPELVVWIQSNYDVETGLDKLEQFDDEWILPNLDQVGTNFSFNIETQ